MFELDLTSKENLYLFSPKLEAQKLDRLREHLRALPLEGHIFILSSGSTSTGELKGYALSKQAVAANADAVNRHLNLGADDDWFLSLPPWHVGGLSVFARAKLAGSQVRASSEAWDPERWAKNIEGCAITSIVPLQAYDLAKANLRAPKSLRHVIVGGDLLSSELRQRLVELGWPVLRTFGMTEVCSQLATEKRPSEVPAVEILDIHEVKTSPEGRLLVKSQALFTGQFKLDERFVFESSDQFSEDGYFVTSDLARIEGNCLAHLGRSDQAFKSKGRLFYFNELRERFANFCLEQGLYGKMELRLKGDKRSGKRVEALAIEELRPRQAELAEALKRLLAPVALEGPVFVPEIGRTELGKPKRV